MTEAQWLASENPRPMLEYLRLRRSRPYGNPRSSGKRELPELVGKSPADRRLWLFCCACARRVQHRLDPEWANPYRKALEMTERYLAGTVSKEEWSSAYPGTPDHGGNPGQASAQWLYYAWPSSVDAAIAISNAVARGEAIYDDADYQELLEQLSETRRAEAEAAERAERQILSGMLRDIIGNPFRPVVLDPAWRTPTVTALAQAVYEERILPAGTLDPQRLAVLADALEDAGCDSADILSHLRGPGPHVRGCWVVDLLLGKE